MPSVFVVGAPTQTFLSSTLAHVLSWPAPKFFVLEPTDCEVRVSARKLPKHGTSPFVNVNSLRSMPPSKKPLIGIGAASHGTVTGLVFTIAQPSTFAPSGTAHGA